MKEDQVFPGEFDNAERIGYLIANYIKGTLTPLERKELDAWILQSEKNELLFDELTSEGNIEKTMEWYATIDLEGAKERMKKKISFVPRRKRRSISALLVAASILLVISIGVLYLVMGAKKATTPTENVAGVPGPVPGSNKAILTIGDGKEIVLDSSAPSTLQNGSIRIGDGTITYSNELKGEPSQNILSIPRGGQYKVVLPDGTAVWLNAESSLKYPTSFSGSERRVELNGEGYFEVTKNKEKPFIVESPAGNITVLGTRFNVNSYGDEGFSRTTLVEGSVRITKGKEEKILSPGEQAAVSGDRITVTQVDTREVTAWKEGEFLFRNASLTSIVSQLQRWYDLQVEFREPVDKHLNATIKRDVPLSKVLHYLEQTGDVHFKTEGKKLIVLK